MNIFLVRRVSGVERGRSRAADERGLRVGGRKLLCGERKTKEREGGECNNNPVISKKTFGSYHDEH